MKRKLEEVPGLPWLLGDWSSFTGGMASLEQQVRTHLTMSVSLGSVRSELIRE
jgi:hypothetical protein